MPTPWDVMQLNPAEALTISCQSCGTKRAAEHVWFVIKELAKFEVRHAPDKAKSHSDAQACFGSLGHRIGFERQDQTGKTPLEHPGERQAATAACQQFRMEKTQWSPNCKRPGKA